MHTYNKFILFVFEKWTYIRIIIVAKNKNGFKRINFKVNDIKIMFIWIILNQINLNYIVLNNYLIQKMKK